MIAFPGLGIEVKISRVAFTIFGIEVYWYGIIIVSAIIIALLLCKKDSCKYGINFSDILELCLYLFPVAIICARLYYCAFNSEMYKSILEIFNIRKGGLAIYGGIIGAVFTIYVYCKIKNKAKINSKVIETQGDKALKTQEDKVLKLREDKVIELQGGLNFLNILDYVVPYLALAQAIGRWGNFANIEAYGTETSLPWRMGIIENNLYKEVHPTFLYESIATFCIFMFLFYMRNSRKYNGQIVYWYFVLYGGIRAIIEGIRIDSLMLGNVRISQVLSIAICVVFGGIICYKTIKCYNMSNSVERGRLKSEKSEKIC